jgi:hypothetical protein
VTDFFVYFFSLSCIVLWNRLGPLPSKFIPEYCYCCDGLRLCLCGTGPLTGLPHTCL